MVTKVKIGLIITLFVLAAALLLSNYVTPDYGIIYKLKRLQENIYFQIKPSQMQKIDYTSELLDQRLSELMYLVGNREYDYILTSAQRYSATAGRLTDLIKNNNFSEKTIQVQISFENHKKILENLVTLCKKEDNTECKYIQDDVNYLKIYLNSLLSQKNSHKASFLENLSFDMANTFISLKDKLSQ